jgi:glycosyltransferase involved in cell wall biosynthesis
MTEASVVICTHNPRSGYLGRVLDALRDQSLPYNEWELLLVDNASEPALAPRWDLSWHPNARHIREDQLGLASARRCGIAAATADLLVFVDDDNVLAGNYLSEALKIKQDWQRLGTWGSGAIIPEFEQKPANYLEPYLHRLALRENKEAYWSNVLSCSRAIPPGAGMCVRVHVAKEYCRLHARDTIHLTGRSGGALVGHEDYEISFVGCHLGFGMGVFPELKMTHLIPKERLSDEYFIRHAEGNQVSGGLLAYKWLGEVPPNPFSLKGVLSLVKHVFLAGGFDRKLYLAEMKGRIAARRAVARLKSSDQSGIAPL